MPGTAAGDRLLADELANVIQQDRVDSVIQRAPRTPDDPVKSPKSPEEEAAAQEVAITNSLTPQENVLRNHSLDKIKFYFHWISEKCGPHIQELEPILSEEDKPSWSEKILGSLVDVALATGASAFGELIAVKYAANLLEKAVKNKSVTKNVAEAGQEFVKSLVEEGTGKGIETGRKALEGGSDKDVIRKFVLSQRDGATDMYKANQDHFIDFGASQIKTVEDAKALEKALEAEYQQAPEIQYGKARDAWVTYLAQQKFGVRDMRGVPTTDMANQERRDKATHYDYGHGYDLKDYGGDDQNPDKAPSMSDAVMHSDGDGGVLYVKAWLPEIKREFDWSTRTAGKPHMEGKPEVQLAILNGVNDKIRDQYQGQALSQIHIPRQIVAKVEGDAPNFTLNLDEKGLVFDYKQKEDWLEDRALVADPAAASKGNWLSQAGIKLLLQELVPDKIKKGFG